jgi:hypothetical protein
MEESDLIIKIEILRRKMIATGISKGLTSPETIQLSQKLDDLLIRKRKSALK